MGSSEAMDSILWHSDGRWHEANAVDTLLHELRTPLGASSYALDVIQRARESGQALDDAEAERMIHTAQLGVLEAQALVRWFYRIRALAEGRLEPEIGPTSLAGAIDRALMLLPEARVRVTLARDVPPVYADPLWLTQTLTNLLENATKHTPESAVAQVFVRRYSPESVVVSVIDNGSGIPVGRQREIFRPYVRVGAADEGEGQGLGLSIAHYFVRAMGGRIWVESDGRSGTTVRFTLPAVAEDE